MWDIYSRRKQTMRINHNIAALNTYRQLNSAAAGQSKSMEKLSSGLRINRAGDDAAGLAISEKNACSSTWFRPSSSKCSRWYLYAPNC
ncbi:flagellin N-terminal helical domain-containing protein [Cytobacillus sp. FSL H8-0458]|uniref:flagellin N-terminal helical domain-containing protein n=1 Tax=Cytobacillus sp. FSL H8-0458 TaxID=2975346 RepID=UPI0030F5DFF3